MKLRDKIALRAMEMIYVREKYLNNRDSLSDMAYKMADAMLEARKSKSKEL